MSGGDDMRLKGAIALLRKAFRDDGAEGESVWMLCKAVDELTKERDALAASARHLALMATNYREAVPTIIAEREAVALAEAIMRTNEALKGIPTVVRVRRATVIEGDYERVIDEMENLRSRHGGHLSYDPTCPFCTGDLR